VDLFCARGEEGSFGEERGEKEGKGRREREKGG